jgi:hypothetical protein
VELLVFDPLHAVPIMAIAAVLASLSRVIIWSRGGPARGGGYSITGVPRPRSEPARCWCCRRG